MTHPICVQTEPEAWCEDIRSALNDFSIVSELAGEEIVFEDEDVEFLPAPHVPPSRLPTGKMAVYAFWFDDDCLKIGKAGPNSHARYSSQHYNINSAGSTLARSIVNDSSMPDYLHNLDAGTLSEWIKRKTRRVNILLPSTRSETLLSLLEAFLHVRLRPRYEGSSRNQRQRSD